MGEVIEFWSSGPPPLRPGRAVLIGFCQDEGLSRNHGRPGAAEAPREIRNWLHRLTPWDAETHADLAALRPLDVGNVSLAGGMEASQEALAEVVDSVLRHGAVPIVLGGGHETAYGHYLGYVHSRRRVGIVNIDAHLDVRPCIDGKGHCGSPFRQALEHTTAPLPGPNYVCLGAQPHSVSRQHWQYAQERGCVVRWASEVAGTLASHCTSECERLLKSGCQVHVSIDADAVQLADVPAVSSPNPTGLAGREVVALARQAGRLPQVASLDLVEINPKLDRDGQSARWAALTVWNFLIGLALRTNAAGRA